MALGEGNTRAALQVPLKGSGARFIRELDYDVDPPRLCLGSVRTSSRVVGQQSLAGIGRETCVIGAAAFTAKDVDEPERSRHARRECNRLFSRFSTKCVEMAQ